MMVMLVEEKTFFFEIRKNILVLTNSMAKDHLLKADLSYDGLSIGTCCFLQWQSATKCIAEM